MELLDYLRALRAHWVGAVVIVVIAVTAAVGFTLTQPKVYAADAGGFVTTGSGSSDPALGSVNDALAKSRAASYVDIATSRAVADLVIDDLGLDDSPASLIGQIEVEQPVDTVLIKITARAASPQQAQRLADAWVRALAERVAELENPTGADASGALGVEPVESAALPTAPVSPRPLLNVGLGFVLGVLLAIAYAVVRSMVDRRLRADDDIERRFGRPTVGRIPVHQGGSRGVQISATTHTDAWDLGEAFRKLRTNLSYMNVDQPPRVIVVTSPRPEDGKSTVAANLAAAIAMSGQPVTLVDGDLRRPTVADSLGLVEGAGLTDVLIGQVDLVDVVQDHVDLPHLSVLAAGSTPPNPSELLGSHAMQGLLGDLALKGMVVIDAPPLLPVTDGAVLTRNSDGALVVISHGRTLDSDLAECMTQLQAVQGSVLGVVFNRIPRRRSRTPYYYAADPATGRKHDKAPAEGGGKRRAR